MTRPECSPVQDDLADLVAGNPDTIERHSAHLATCDDCRDARHDASQLAKSLAHAGSDYVLPADLVERVLIAAGNDPVAAPAPARAPAPAPVADKQVTPITAAPRKRTRVWLALGAAAAMAAGGLGIYAATHRDTGSSQVASLPGGAIGKVQTIDRAAKDKTGGLEVKDGNAWRALRPGELVPAGAQVRTDERTRAAIELADGTRFVLDHKTALAFDPVEARRTRLTAGRIVADVVHVDDRPAAVETPTGHIDVIGTRFAVTATDKLTSVQVVRGEIALSTPDGKRDQVRAGEEGVIENGALAVNAAPGLAREVEWSELGPKPQDTEAGAGLGALRAYKPGETRDRDWNLTLASHDVKVRIVGPVARTEITETFRNDSDQQLEGVYQFPLPADAQIDALALDVANAPGGFEQGAFVDKERAQKIWRGVIDKAAPKKLEIAQDEIIWVDGSWRDPALLDWKRGGRFELKIFPIPAKGQRTIKIAYTQIVTPRGPWRQYVYPLPHSADGSTVADQLTVDVEVRGAKPGQVRAAGYDLQADPVRADVNALTLKQTGFVPRGDLVVDYRADNDAELRAWTFAGGFAVAPDAKLADKKNVGIDMKVVDAQRQIASDTRPTAVLALKPKLPRWREAKARDYMIVIDSSQSMVGERYTRAGELAARLVEQMDRRDRFTVMACDSECKKLGDLKSPSVAAAGELATWLKAQPAAGASDIVAAIRTAATELPAAQDHERWVIYVGDGFASTGFRKAGDVEKAIAQTTKGVNVTTIGIGTDADAAVLAAVARGGGGSYLAWLPGQSVKTAAIAGLESTYGSALRDAKIELPQGLADVAPTVLPTLRNGDEVLVAARITGEVAGDVVVKGTVGGQAFEQRYPLKLAVSTSPGNGFVPRLWASLAIEQLERTTDKPTGDERTRMVALSQGYGVMSKETSLLVLESPAMFDAFGVDRSVPAAKWTGTEAIEETTSAGTIQHQTPRDDAKDMARATKSKKADLDLAEPTTSAPAATPMPNKAPVAGDLGGADGPVAAGGFMGNGRGRRGWGGGMIAMRRTWVKVPSVSAYDGVSPSISKAIGDAERALAKSPDSRERHRALVQALSYAGELDRANQLAAKWLDRDRLDPQALGYQADLLGRDGKRELALRMLAGIVDLDADRSEAHERMVTAYEHVGRMSQACSHRIALTAIAPKDGKAAAAAVRCLRSLSRDADAELVLASLATETRSAAEKALLDAPAPAKGKDDVVIDARWDGGDDLDVSLVTPEGTRISWMGGRTDVHVSDATNTAHEQLALKSIKKGNYLIEIGRGGANPSTVPARGTLDITVLGTKKSLPFELTGSHKSVGRLTIGLEERVETLDPNNAKVGFGHIPNPVARRVMLARSDSIQACFTTYLMTNPDARGRLMLTITVDASGQTQTRATGPAGTEVAQRCVEQALMYMHVEGTAAGQFRVPLTFSSGR